MDLLLRIEKLVNEVVKAGGDLISPYVLRACPMSGLVR
jgi:hypothetical protein